ncbi:MAG: hypothetical protein LBD93_12710 [Treponema sp.]|nr:hypothetical protein [Treponema sp.]
MPDKATEEQEKQGQPQAQQEELQDEDLDQATGGSGVLIGNRIKNEGKNKKR